MYKLTGSIYPFGRWPNGSFEGFSPNSSSSSSSLASAAGTGDSWTQWQQNNNSFKVTVNSGRFRFCCVVKRTCLRLFSCFLLFLLLGRLLLLLLLGSATARLLSCMTLDLVKFLGYISRTITSQNRSAIVKSVKNNMFNFLAKLSFGRRRHIPSNWAIFSHRTMLPITDLNCDWLMSVTNHRLTLLYGWRKSGSST